MKLNDRRHVEEILCLVEEQNVLEQTSKDPIILESWQRCMRRYKLEPTVMREAHILPQQSLHKHQNQLEDFLHTARFGVETLYRQIACLGYVLLLTDAHGITVDFIGDPTLGNQLDGAGLLLGTDWSEQHAGTCAVGTSLSTQQALTVHQSDHFFPPYTAFTCTAAPIFNPYGELLAVLTIAALHPPQPKSSQHLALNLVQHHAHRIEKANFFKEFGREWIVKFGSSQEFADVDPEFLLALDASGKILGLNHHARQLLSNEDVSAPLVSCPLIGRHFEDFFDCGLDDLGEFVQSRPIGQLLIRSASQHRTLFAQALPPQDVPHRTRNSTPVSELPSLPSALAELTGGDPMLLQHLTKAEQLINSNVSILLTGETGTGKEHFAKAIHRASERSGKPFVAVNCVAIPESLIESELFGYVSGAFTGAQTKGKKGLILQAEGGTLFLDEIGDMPLQLQARLLRVLAEREVLPIGAVTPVTVNLHLISASHHDLLQLVQDGCFRDDLYYRLNGAMFALPPLRHRQDFDWMVNRLLQSKAVSGQAVPGITTEVMHLFHKHTWPGNIRELVNTIDFASAVCNAELIRPEDLPELFHHLRSKRWIDLHSKMTDAVPECDRHDLKSVLKRHHWNISAAARELNICRATVYRRMRHQNLIAPNHR